MNTRTFRGAHTDWRQVHHIRHDPVECNRSAELIAASATVQDRGKPLWCRLGCRRETYEERRFAEGSFEVALGGLHAELNLAFVL
jgi:hypothetical protein